MRRLAWLLAAALAAGVSDAAGAPDRRAALEAAVAVAGTDAARLRAVTAPLLAAPYVHSPLGEGEGPDADPRVRFDAFDCLTFVETAMALEAARTLDDVPPLLDDIRYSGPARSFESRNHFVESQWVPRNLEKGWLRPAASAIGGAHVAVASKASGPALFARRSRPELLPLAPGAVPAGTFGLEVVPLEVARENLDRFRDGQLVFVVRTDAPRQPTRVTHAGLVFTTPAGPVLRHASRDPYHRVVDEPLARFLARNAAYEKWHVVGLAVYDLRIPKERVARLTRAALR